MHRRDGLKATVMQLGQSLWETFEDEAESSRNQSFHRPHRSVIFNSSSTGQIISLPDNLNCFELHSFGVLAQRLWSIHTVCLRDTRTGTGKNGLYDIMQNVSHYTGTGTL